MSAFLRTMDTWLDSKVLLSCAVDQLIANGYEKGLILPAPKQIVGSNLLAPPTPRQSIAPAEGKGDDEEDEAQEESDKDESAAEEEEAKIEAES